MYMSSFMVENYKSFRKTDRVGLTPGFNVIVGQNNVGKTALVEALSLKAGNVPHRSLAALPSNLTPVSPGSRVELTFGLHRTEILELLRDVVAPPRWLPQHPNQGNAEQNAMGFNVLIMHGVHLRCTFEGTGLAIASFEGFTPHTRDVVPAMQIEADISGIRPLGGWNQTSREACCDFRLAAHLQGRVYAFKAERLNIGACRFGANSELQTNAANLAEVLANLQADSAGFDELNRLFSLVFPTIKRVTVRPLPNETVEVLIWNEPPNTRRLDLAMPLAACGTGLGQVLAMLYVVLTAQQPRVFII